MLMFLIINNCTD